MKYGNTKRYLPAILFIILVFMTAGSGAYAAQYEPDGDSSEGGIQRIDITVRCDWDDEGNRDGTRPEQVTVALYAGSRETGRMITLCEENGWRGCFENMDVYRDGERLSYSVIEERVEGYTGTIEGSDLSGFRIVNIHEPLPEGRSGSEEIIAKKTTSGEKGVIVETVVTTKVSKSVPARTSTSPKKTRSAKTADTSNPVLWEILLICSCAALRLCLRIEKSRE